MKAFFHWKDACIMAKISPTIVIGGLFGANLGYGVLQLSSGNTPSGAFCIGVAGFMLYVEVAKRNQ